MSMLLTSSLALVVAMDLASALLLSTAIDPAHYLEHAWWHQTFLLGESTFDLLVLAVLRALLLPLTIAVARCAAAIASTYS